MFVRFYSIEDCKDIASQLSKQDHIHGYKLTITKVLQSFMLMKFLRDFLHCRLKECAQQARVVPIILSIEGKEWLLDDAIKNNILESLRGIAEISVEELDLAGDQGYDLTEAQEWLQHLSDKERNFVQLLTASHIPH